MLDHAETYLRNSLYQKFTIKRTDAEAGGKAGNKGGLFSPVPLSKRTPNQSNLETS